MYEVGGRFGQDLKNSEKTSRYVWASFWSRTIALQNSPIRFSSKWRKNSGDLKILPRLTAKVPICLWLELCTMICWGAPLRAVIRAVTTRGKGHNSPGAESLWGRRKVQQCHTKFSTVHLLLKDLRFEHRGAKLVSCPGRHLTSLRP